MSFAIATAIQAAAMTSLEKVDGDEILANNIGHSAEQIPTKIEDTESPLYGLVKVRRNIRDDDVRDRNTISYKIDWEKKMQVFTYNDNAAEIPYSKITLSLQTWWPDGTSARAKRWVNEAIAQITEDSTPFFVQVPGLVRMVQDINDNITHVNWIGADPITGKDQATYFYTSKDPVNGQPAIMASVSRGGYPVADRWAKAGKSASRVMAPSASQPLIKLTGMDLVSPMAITPSAR